MNIGTIKKGLEHLLVDAHEAEKLLTENRDSQFIRRVYIRSIFAYIEGSIWTLKQVCLNAKPINNEKRKISISEYTILTEESFDLKNNGDIKVVTKSFNILDNIKFTFKTINKLFHGNIDLGIGTEKWNNLIEAKNIRNRITHPKKEKDLEVSLDEISLCEKVCSWFNELVLDCFNLFIESGKNKNE